jgi:hypothetical protein
MDSATSRVVARYECHDVPDVLYRVQYDDATSLRARAKPVFQTPRAFKTAVERHINWASRERTPFVSTFADREHAINWARHCVNGGRSYEAVVISLDVYRLGHIFRVRDLVHTRVVTTNLRESLFRDEYLVLGEIRRRSVFDETLISKDSSEEESSDYYPLSDDSSDGELQQNFGALRVATNEELYQNFGGWIVTSTHYPRGEEE